MHPLPRRLSILAGATLLFTLVGCAGAAESAVTIPATPTPPGTALAIGETALVSGHADARDSGKAVEVEVGFTVLDVHRQDAAFYDKISNPEDFAGFVPWTVTTQVTLTAADEASHTDPTAPGVYGVLGDGTFAQYLSMADLGPLDGLCPGATGSRADNYFVWCDVILVPEAATLSHLEWDGLDNDETPAAGVEHPFVDAPLTWTIPAQQ